MSTITLHDSVHSVEATHADLSSSRFEDVRLAESTFSEVSLAGCTFHDIYLDGCAFDHVSLVGVKISEGHYEGMTIEGIPVLALLDAYRSAHERNDRAAGNRSADG